MGKTKLEFSTGPKMAKSPPNNGIFKFDEKSTIFFEFSKSFNHNDFSTTLGDRENGRD